MPQSSPRKSPPNYSSRAMQWRLLILVGGLMLVLVMMDEARKPENWMWMGFDDSAETNNDDSNSIGVSPRLADLFSTRSPDNSLFGALAQEGDEATDDADKEQSDPNSVDAVAQSLLQITRRTFEQLTDEQLQRLFVDIGLLTDLKPLASEHQAERFQVADRLEKVADRELAEFRRLAVKGADPALPSPWDPLLKQVRQRVELIVELLKSGALREDLTVGQLQEITQYQRVLDQVALEQIDDNTFGPRSSDQHAWYRIFQLMEQAEQDQRETNAARVTAYDLAEQPSEYRGRWVELTGEVRKIKQVSLANNRTGFQDYWEIWLRPENGPDVPVCVYVRELPEGFPAPKTQDESLELKETATVEGCFFKIMSYRSSGGLRVTPLVLAISPSWQPKAAPTASPQTRPTWQGIALIAGFCFVVAGIVAWLAYRSTNRNDEERQWPEKLKIGGLFLLMFGLAYSAPKPVVAQEDSKDSVEEQGQSEGDSSAETDQLPPWLLTQGDGQQTLEASTFFELFPDITASEIDRLGDFDALDPNEPVIQLMLSRLTLIGPRQLQRNCQLLDASLFDQTVEKPFEVRGHLMRFRGRILKVEQIELSDATWDQFERDVLYRVEVACGGTEEDPQKVVVLVADIPDEWATITFPRDEANVAGVFIHLEPRATDDQPPVPLLIADRLAWFPIETPISPWQQFWCDLDFDYGRWKIARNREGLPLQAADGACLYAMLSRSSPDSLTQVPSGAIVEPFDLFEVLRDPNENRGSVFELEGIAKRITRIPTGEDLYANDEQVSEYYQIDMLLPLNGRRVLLGDKSRGATITGRYPVTICVRELPDGVSTGDNLNMRMSLVAAFYRNWKYRSEYLRRVDEDLRQLSPLMVGLSVKRQSGDQSATWLTQIAVGVLVLAMVLTGIGYLFLRRSDQKYAAERSRVRSESLPDRLDWTEPNSDPSSSNS